MKLSIPRKILSYGKIIAFQPVFNVNKENGYHSIFSFALSFIFYVVFFIMITYFSDDWVQQKNPQLSFTGGSFNDIEKMNFSDIINSGIDILKEYTFSEDIRDIFNKTNLTKDNFFTLYIKIEEYITLSESKVLLIIEKNLSFEIKDNKTLYIDVSLLPNETYSITDNRDEIIKKYNSILSNLTIDIKNSISIDISYRNKLFDNEKYSNFSIFQENSVTIIQPELYYFDSTSRYGFPPDSYNLIYEINQQKIDLTQPKNRRNIEPFQALSLNFLVVKDDRGDIFSKTEVNRKLQFNLSKKGYSYNILAQFVMSNKMNIFIRKYKKLQNVLADVGGILTSLITLFKIISEIFNVRLFNYDIINLLCEKDSNIQIRNNINKNILLENKNKIKTNLKVIDKSYIEASSNRDLIVRKLDNPNEIEKRCVSVPNNNKNSSIVENFNRNNIDDNDNKEVPKSNIIDKEKIKEEIEKLKNEHFIKRGEKLFFKKDRESKFIKMSKTDFCKLFIPFDKFKSKEEVMKEKIFVIAEEKMTQYLDVFNFLRFTGRYFKIEVNPIK